MALRKSAQRTVLCASCAARFLTKVICASCVVPGCCAQVALCKLLRANGWTSVLDCSAHVALCKFLAARRSALVSAHKMLSLCCAHTRATTYVLKSYKFPAGAAEALRVRATLVLKGCDFPAGDKELREHAPRTTFVNRSCDFRAGAAADQGGIEPATWDCEAGAQTTRQLPKAVSRARNSHGATARALRHAQSPQRVRRD